MVEFVTIIQKPKQDLIDSKNRSTLISFESLAFSLIFIVFNPLVGRFTQSHPIVSLYSITLGLIFLITVLLITNKQINKELG